MAAAETLLKKQSLRSVQPAAACAHSYFLAAAATAATCYFILIHLFIYFIFILHYCFYIDIIRYSAQFTHYSLVLVML